MATIEGDLEEERSLCENTPEPFGSEFVTELSNKLDHLSPGEECMTNIDMFDDRLNEMTASYSEISFDSQTPPDVVSDFEVSLVSPADFLEQGMDKVSERSSRYDDVFTDCDSKRPDRLELREIESADRHDQFHQAFEDLNLAGTVTKDGDMVLFVAEDLETKIKLSSPVMKKGDTPSFPGSRTSTPCLYRQALTPQLPPIDPSVLNDLEAEVKKVATSVDTLTENLAGILRSVSALTVDCLEIYRDAVCKTCDSVDSNIKSMYQLMAKCEELSKSMKPIYKLSELLKGIKRLLDLFENAVNV